ncbi:hypothetical protein BC941DRAFT_473916 [Chlamydoabsidia padenii]|nr:hypothetical protein BC941DRAFT_473916 [Chlamydoabsidia padenii]
MIINYYILKRLKYDNPLIHAPTGPPQGGGGDLGTSMPQLTYIIHEGNMTHSGDLILVGNFIITGYLLATDTIQFTGLLNVFGSSSLFASVISYGHSTTISTPGPFEQTNESNALNDFYEGTMSTSNAAMFSTEF